MSDPRILDERMLAAFFAVNAETLTVSERRTIERLESPAPPSAAAGRSRSGPSGG